MLFIAQAFSVCCLVNSPFALLYPLSIPFQPALCPRRLISLTAEPLPSEAMGTLGRRLETEVKGLSALAPSWWGWCVLTLWQLPLHYPFFRAAGMAACPLLYQALHDALRFPYTLSKSREESSYQPSSVALLECAILFLPRLCRTHVPSSRNFARPGRKR